MKRILLPTVAVLFLSLSVIAQNKSLPLNENKYRIDLPDYWGKGNKVWSILTEKLPLVCEELKDKDICGDDCHPKYTIEFYITEPELLGYSKHKKSQLPSTNTRVLVNSVPTISLVSGSTFQQRPEYFYSPAANPSASEKWQLSGQYIFQCFLLLRNDSGQLLTKFILVDTNELWFSEYKGKQAVYSPSQNSDVFFEKNKDQFIPDKFELLAIVDKKILAL